MVLIEVGVRLVKLVLLSVVDHMISYRENQIGVRSASDISAGKLNAVQKVTPHDAKRFSEYLFLEPRLLLHFAQSHRDQQVIDLQLFHDLDLHHLTIFMVLKGQTFFRDWFNLVCHVFDLCQFVDGLDDFVYYLGFLLVEVGQFLFFINLDHSFELASFFFRRHFASTISLYISHKRREQTRLRSTHLTLL